MLEAVVEMRLKRLERKGFAVYKLRTPGKSGVMDRMILWPKYQPNPPMFVEFKRPETPKLRPLQAAVERDWLARGCDVRPYCSTIEEVDDLVDGLIAIVQRRWEAQVYGE